jgi:hypothetical protein
MGHDGWPGQCRLVGLAGAVIEAAPPTSAGRQRARLIEIILNNSAIT